MLREFLSNLANAFRSKLGTTDTINAQDFSDKVDEVYDKGYEDYRKIVWDSLQRGGNRTLYGNLFRQGSATTESFRPIYDIKPTDMATMFMENNGTLDLVEALEKSGVVIDTSNCTNIGLAFYGATVTRIPTLDLSKCTLNDRAFENRATKTIIKLIFSETTKFINMFNNTPALENLTVDGIISNNGFNVSTCTKLTHDSLMSIINTLADKTTDTSGTNWVCTLGSTNLAKLSDAEKAIATQKGWTLA